MVALSQNMTSQLSKNSNATSLHNQTKIDISQIQEKDVGESFVISCHIQKLETRYDWKYDGCSKCGSKAKLDYPSSICHIYKKIPESIVPKMKIHYLVKDASGSASIIFWDKLAVQLVKKTASELLNLLKEQDDDDDFSNELDLPVGKNVLLKLKLNEYNKKYPTSSISVSQYTICEDLLSQFNEANVETHSEGSSEVQQNVEPVVEGVIPLGTPLEDSTIAVLPQQVTPTAVTHRGKRRITNKRNVVKDDLTTTIHTPSAGLTEERVSKVIKQEK
ncbi:hypothetical protein QN277_018790 [Acacia crassicarpa]|nr:hypothetical protein QN277_018790 [Acacia crassicarpa]